VNYEERESALGLPYERIRKLAAIERGHDGWTRRRHFAVASNPS